MWAAVLATSLVMIVGFARAGSTLFWRSPVETTPAPAVRNTGAHAAVALALAMIVALTVFAGPVVRHMDAAAAQTLARTPYIEAVFAPAREAQR
jgi:multicomponent K+:H+ antiporter subunit D